MGRAVRVRDDLVIPASEIALQYVRASGPGGQNVNKVASKAVLRFNVRDSPSLAAADRERVLARLAPRLTNEGELVLASGVYRDQSRNREAVLTRTLPRRLPAVRAVRRGLPIDCCDACATLRKSIASIRSMLRRSSKRSSSKGSMRSVWTISIAATCGR